MLGTWVPSKMTSGKVLLTDHIAVFSDWIDKGLLVNMVRAGHLETSCIKFQALILQSQEPLPVGLTDGR